MDLAAAVFREIHLVQFSLGGWSDGFTAKLKIEFSHVEIFELSATKKPIFQWLFSTMINYLLNKVNVENLSLKLIAFSLNKRTIILNRFLKKLDYHYDFIVAHNPGAFFPAFQLAQRLSSKLGLDLEDYHPGEYNDERLTMRMKKLMSLIMLNANYCSFASPLIRKEFELDLGVTNENWLTIINGFPKIEFEKPVPVKSQKIKMVWFSQNITPGRGLENFISVISEFSSEIEFHLVGFLTEPHKAKLCLDKCNFVVHKPMDQRELHVFLKSFQVGLAIEPGKDLNNEIAVSNKLITYCQAGLFVVATPTRGQISFLTSSNLDYVIIKNEVDEIKLGITEVIKHIRNGEFNGCEQYEKAQIFSWETINYPLVDVWKR